MEPWQSWFIAVTIAGAAYFYYSNGAQYILKRAPQTPEPSTQLSSSRKRPEKQKRGNAPKANEKHAERPWSYAEAASSDTPAPAPSGAKKRKAGPGAQAEKTSGIPAVNVNGANNKLEDEEGGDIEWAKQLDARQKGVSLTNSASSGKGGKAISGTQFRNDDSVASRSRSPNARSDNVPIPASNDVTDMLEPSAPGPSAIRITGEEKARKPKVSNSEPAQETKKQRQNRKKAEEKKQQREADEKERQLLLENQRRMAREARGEPSKNGLSSSQPSKSAWAAGVQTGSTTNGSGPTTNSHPASNPTQLLDTFEHDATSTTSSREYTNSSTTPATTSSTLDREVPSEEAQIQVLSQMNGDSGWNEVSTKGKKGKKKGQGQPTPPTSAPVGTNQPNGREDSYKSESSTSGLVNEYTKPSSSTPSNQKATGTSNGFAVLEETTDFSSSSKGHPDDSDWAVG